MPVCSEFLPRLSTMKPRAIWTGYIKISLVTIPVRLYGAVNESDKISFNQLHKNCHQRLRQQLVCPIHGKVEREDVVKGYELEKDRFVVVEPSELEALKLETTRGIEVSQFISQDELDPFLLDTPYYLGPDGPVSEEAFVIFRESLQRSRQIGLGRVVMAGRERLVALAPLGKGMVLTALRYPAEIRQAGRYFEEISAVKPDEAQLRLAQQLIENKTAPFDPAAFTDRYQAALLDTIKGKLNGTQPIKVPQTEANQVVDLMAALTESVAQTATVKAQANGHKPFARVREIANHLWFRAASLRGDRSNADDQQATNRK